MADKLLVHVCSFRVSQYTNRLPRFSHWLSQEENAHARRFVREADRSRFTLGRAIVRYLCGTHLRIEPTSVRLKQTSSGKPYLANPFPSNTKALDFSVAHSGDCVLVAWADGQPVGVDVEAIDRDSDSRGKDISSSVFSQMEQDALFAATPNEFAKTFYRIWVRKEALLKAEGCGLGGSLESFSVVRRHLQRIEWLDEVHYPASDRSWMIVDLTPAAGHAGALAMPRGSAVCEHMPHEIVL